VRLKNEALNKLNFGLVPPAIRYDVYNEDKDISRYYVKCGNIEVHLGEWLEDIQEGNAHDAYMRPDLYGYSPLHAAIPSFVSDEICYK
jgi:hypothetical protein